MSLPGKKGRDPSQLPTLSYEIKLNLPANVDSNPQEVSFLDLIANDTKFKNDKEGLEFVLSSYVKACGKQSVKEILAERDTIVEDNASLSDIIRALMDYNDQQNANLGVGYNDPEDDDSFIDDSTAAQDVVPKNMTNERDGFYVNEKHQPIQARYLSEPSESDSEEDDGDSDDSDDDSSDSEKEDKDKQNKKINNHEDSNEKNAKKSKIDDDTTTKVPNTKRKRSVSEVTAPSLPINLSEKDKTLKVNEEPVKKVKKLSETTGEPNATNFVSYVLPNEMDGDIKPSIEKLVKLILLDQTITDVQKKVERLFNSNVCRELLDLVKKLQRHTNANRQLVFDILSARTGISAPILITRGRLLLLNDYEPAMASVSMNELKEKLKVEINRSLEIHIQAHEQAIKEWQQKMIENPSKDKNRGPRKNFRLHKTINELIIRCIDRRLESLTIIDTDTLELFLHDHIVPLWGKPGWMTAKKIISEVIRIEYRPLRDSNPLQNQPIQATRVIVSPSTTERMKKEPQTISQTSPKILNPVPNATSSVINAAKVSQPQNLKANDIKPSNHAVPTNNQVKSLEMATRVTAPNPIKQHTPRPTSNELTTSNPIKQNTSRPISNELTTTNQLTEQLVQKTNKSDVIRPIAKPATVSPSSQPSDSSTKRNSTPNPLASSSAAIDFSMDLFSQYKKYSHDPLKVNPQPSPTSTSNKDLSTSQRSTPPSTSSVNHPKQQQQQQQQQQFATKVPSEKSPGGSFLKEALSGATAPKMTPSPLTVDNMIGKPLNSPKTNTSSSTMKPPATTPSPTNNTQRSSSSTSTKSNTNRPSTDFTHHRTDQQMQQQKPSSSSNRPPSTTASSSSSSSASISPATSRRSTTGFPSSHEQQSNRAHSSQVTIPPALSQSLQWDSATLQLAAAALANPQLLNSSVFDPNLFNSVFATAANMVSSNQPSSSSSSSRQQQQQHSQNTNNNRRT